MFSKDPFSSTSHLVLTGIVEGSEAYALSELARHHKAPLIIIARNDQHMQMLSESVAFFMPEAEVLNFPAWDCQPYDRVSPNPSIISERIDTLTSLIQPHDKRVVVITTINAAAQRIIPKSVVDSATQLLETGGELDRDELASFLVNQGYRISSNAMDPGEFALRGSIVDIMIPGMEQGIRLDLFGNDVESIRLYDPVTQISKDTIDRVMLKPANEVLINDSTIAQFKSQYRGLFGAVISADPLYEAISEGRHYTGMEHWLPLFYETTETLFDYIPNATIVMDQHAEQTLEERQEVVEDYYDHRQEQSKNKTMSDVVYNAIPPEQHYIEPKKWLELCDAKRTITHTPLDVAETPFDAETFNFPIKRMDNFAILAKSAQTHAIELFKKTILNEPEKQCLIAAMSEGSKERLISILSNHEVVPNVVEEWKPKVSKGIRGKLQITVLPLEHGFNANQLSIVTEQDLLGEQIRHKVKRKSSVEALMKEAASLEIGDLVVHKQHGIARFEGLETMHVGGVSHDCLKLIYANNDKLFLPVENSDIITRYGNDESDAHLDKLGGAAWQERKAKLKKRLKMAAEELMKIAAARETQQAPAVDADALYQEFCARFPYPETDDQLRAIAEVENDLSKTTPMDRLICGDVGFGKTEIALRAAFLAANPNQKDKGQVAIIAPTTLLCRQHFLTFKERFDGFPVKIRQLSRLQSAKQLKETKEAIAEGDVDIVIGTHALLAKDINFKKLSLMVIDEEQRFGVKQKEALKKLKANCHVLTLSATPIPRTLQMAMAGIRELSLIATPPVDRLAVRTFVMPFDSLVIREAVLREHYRGGQIFYVAPRIGDLAEVEKTIRNLVPEITLQTAHGQLPPAELDQIMQNFYDRKFDMLLATTIVESGLDVPSANTILIHRADKFGLAQLYQLRGRVGRGKTRAYAYLTLPNRKRLTKQAERRLEVMQTLDSLGAGFSLASHDMDIRGAGNLLGEEQSGHIKEVGVELYQQMLAEAVEAIKVEQGTLQDTAKHYEFSPTINLGISIFIPEDYIQDLSLRMSLYQRIASLNTDQEIEAMAAEMIDRFGPIPEQVEHLFTVMKMKIICQQAGIEKLEVGPKGAMVSFYKNEFSNPEKLLDFIMKRPTTMKLRGDQSIVIQGKGWEEVGKRISDVKTSVDQLSDLAA